MFGYGQLPKQYGQIAYQNYGIPQNYQTFQPYGQAQRYVQQPFTQTQTFAQTQSFPKIHPYTQTQPQARPSTQHQYSYSQQKYIYAPQPAAPQQRLFQHSYRQSTQLPLSSRMNYQYSQPIQQAQLIQNVTGQIHFSPQRRSVQSQPIRLSPGNLQHSYISTQGVQPPQQIINLTNTVSPNKIPQITPLQQYTQQPFTQSLSTYPILTYAQTPTQLNQIQTNLKRQTEFFQPNRPNFIDSQHRYQQNIAYPQRVITQSPNKGQRMNLSPLPINHRMVNQQQYLPPRQVIQSSPQQLKPLQYQPQQLQQQLFYPPQIQAQQQQFRQQQYQQPQLQPQPLQQQKQQPNQVPPKKVTNKKDTEELEKRFEAALERTKNIVAKFNNDQKTQSRLQDDQQVEPENQEGNEQADEQEGDDNNQNEEAIPQAEQALNEEQEDQGEETELEKLALQYEDGYIFRGQGIPPQTRQGFGVLTDADDQELYSGFWLQNFYHGEGRLSNLNPERIVGKQDWSDMTTIGNGWASYEGEFQKGKMYGRGSLVLTNNEKYFGTFKDGMVHGLGQFVDVDENIINGEWAQGIFLQIKG